MSKSLRFLSFAVLTASLALIGIGGLYGGIVFLLDPSGGLMGMSRSYLDGLPLQSYFLPGLWLFVVMGICPFVILYGLWSRVDWPWTAAIERRGHAHWAWIAALILTIVLLLQLGVELLLGMLAPPTAITGFLGLTALCSLLLPTVRRYYAQPPGRATTQGRTR